MEARFFIVGTPIGNLGDMSLRALNILKEVAVIYCEDTRRTIKLLNHYEIKKPLKSCPYFKERSQVEPILNELKAGRSVAYVSDAGMPGLSDPGEILVDEVRAAGFKVEVIGGVSSLTNFIAGIGEELESFRFIGFLPPRRKDRAKVFSDGVQEPTIFFESPHRIESTLEILQETKPSSKLAFAKEMTKINETFFKGSPEEVVKSITSFKGEWVGCLFPEEGKK
jgi:16S rRNA (cytidine1402-2'-O)-methyltransferase